MELKEGMYARYNGRIGKIKYICDCEQCKARGYLEPVIEHIHNEEEYVSCYFKDNLKASYNIIDLIEVGDYVNGYKVTRISGTLYDENDLHCYCDESWNKDKRCLLMIPANEIKSIVTKEQFESMSYKVGE